MEVRAEVELLKTVTGMLEKKGDLINEKNKSNKEIHQEIDNKVISMAEKKENLKQKALYCHVTSNNYKKLQMYLALQDISLKDWVNKKIEEIK